MIMNSPRQMVSSRLLKTNVTFERVEARNNDKLPVQLDRLVLSRHKHIPWSYVQSIFDMYDSKRDSATYQYMYREPHC